MSNIEVENSKIMHFPRRSCCIQVMLRFYSHKILNDQRVVYSNRQGMENQTSKQLKFVQEKNMPANHSGVVVYWLSFCACLYTPQLRPALKI
jgi:hypothetical protein